MIAIFSPSLLLVLYVAVLDRRGVLLVGVAAFFATTLLYALPWIRDLRAKVIVSEEGVTVINARFHEKIAWERISHFDASGTSVSSPARAVLVLNSGAIVQLDAIEAYPESSADEARSSRLEVDLLNEALNRARSGKPVLA